MLLCVSIIPQGKRPEIGEALGGKKMDGCAARLTDWIHFIMHVTNFLYVWLIAFVCLVFLLHACYIFLPLYLELPVFVQYCLSAC